MDEETALWPVPIAISDDMQRVALTHTAVPLAVYKDATFVDPTEVELAIKNALVEIHFGILHYKIGRPGANFDSFTAAPKQLIVLKAAPLEPNSGYKRKNVRSGPIRPKNFEDFDKNLPNDNTKPKDKSVASTLKV